MQDNNKKIALFSCHNEPNYGSMLQAYALAESIHLLGKHAEYVNYHVSQKPTLLSRLRRCVSWLLHVLYIRRRESEFAFFQTEPFRKVMEKYAEFHQKYMPVANIDYDSDSVKNIFSFDKYSRYIVGSDQMWAPHLYSPNKPYFLDWLDFPNRNSYATSLGGVVFTDEYLSLLIDKLSKFDNISCREKTNCKMLSEKLGKDVKYVLDPTLLLNSVQWGKVAISPLSNKRPYILAYILGEKDCITQFAEKLGQKKNLPVYYILTRPKYLTYKNVLGDVGPAEFVGLIRDADYIVTDSFHGSLFSINFNRNFYAFSKREGNLNTMDNVRILEFLSELGLQSRFQADSEAVFLSDIEYTDVNRLIETLRDSSNKYLKSIVC